MYRALFAGLLLFLAIGCKSDPPRQASAPSTLSTVDPRTVATISGVVKFDGKAPSAQKIDMSYDPACMFSKEDNYSEAFVVDSGHLQNVYVYVKSGLGGKSFAPPAQPVAFDQIGCRYRPHVLAAMTGQHVEIRNSDTAMHNVHAPTFNESQMPKSAPILKTFDTPAVMMPIQCNQHPWMKMFINISSHPFFAVTDKDGRFSIAGLPPGTYTLAAVHERMGEKLINITVAPKSSNVADFSYSQADVK